MVKIAAIVLSLVVAGVVLTRGSGTPTVPTTRVSGELITTISHGEQVDLQSHLVPGEWTLFEYYADW